MIELRIARRYLWAARKEAHTAGCRPLWCSIDDRNIALWMGIFQGKAGLLLTLRVSVWTRGLMQSPFTEGGKALRMRKGYVVLLRLLQTQ